MKKILFVTALLFSLTASAQDKPKLDTLQDNRIVLIVKGDTLETFKPGNKRYVVIDGKRVNVFRREPVENKGHYEFAKF